MKQVRLYIVVISLTISGCGCTSDLCCFHCVLYFAPVDIRRWSSVSLLLQLLRYCHIR